MAIVTVVPFEAVARMQMALYFVVLLEAGLLFPVKSP